MVRAFYITGLSVAFVFMITTIALFFYVDDLRHGYHNSTDYGSGLYSFRSRPHVQVTRVIGVVSLLVFFFYVFLYIFGMIKARNTTVLVMGILGLLFTGSALIFDLIMIMDARHITFDEVGLFFSVWAFFMLGFCIPCVFVTSPAQLEQERLMREYQRSAYHNPYQQWPQQYHQQQQGTNYHPPHYHQQVPPIQNQGHHPNDNRV